MQNEKKPKKRQNEKKDNVEKQQNNEQAEKQQYAKENIPDEYTEEQQEEEENPWHVRKSVVGEYIDEDQEEEEEEEEENPWRVRRNIVEGYIEKQEGEEYDEEQQNEDDTEKRLYIANGVNDEYIEGEQDDGQHEMPPEVVDEQSPLTSHFNYTRQRRHQGEEEVVVSADEQSHQSSHVSFIGQLWNLFRGSAVPTNGPSHQTSQGGFMEQIWNQYKRFVRPANGPSHQTSQSSFMEQIWSQYKEFVAAACFLSILPLSGKAQSLLENQEDKPQLVIGSAYFPLVGLVIALVACLLLVVGPVVHLPSLVIAALVTVALVWLTGGLHLDGLMDTCDGLFDGGTRERKLEIMHDSHSGAFGVLGGICVLLLKFALFASLDLHHLAMALLIVLPVARWAIVLVMSMFPNALLTGLGAAARQTITPPRILIAVITSLLIALVVGQLIGLAVWIVGSLVALIMGIWITYILNGLTGDTYGAIAEVTEVICLLVLVGMR